MTALGQFLFLLYATLWPWGVCQRARGFDALDGTVMLAGLLLALWLADLLRRRPHTKMPPTLLWPPIVAAACSLATQGVNADSVQTIGGLLLFLACIRLAYSSEAIRFALAASCLSGAAVSAVGLALKPMSLLPAAYSPRYDAMLATFPTFAPAAAALSVLLLVALWWTWRLRHSSRLWWAACCGGVIGIVLFQVMRPALAEAVSTGPSHSILGIVKTIALLSVAISVIVEALRAWRDASADVRVHRGLSLGITAVLAAALALGMPFSLDTGFLLGMAASLFLAPQAKSSPITGPWAVVLLAVACPLLLGPWTPWHRTPGENDPRNYKSLVASALSEYRVGAAREQLAYLCKNFPNERGIEFGIAQLALKEGLPYEAAWHFTESLKPTKNRQTYPVLPAERTAFLESLRTRCAELPNPERSFAYEKALVASGNKEEALRLLRARVQAPTNPFSADDHWRDAFLRAARFLLADPTLEFKGWNAAELLVLLEQWGAVVTAAPEMIGRDALPAICAYDATGGLAAICAQSESRTRFEAPAVTRPAPAAHWVIEGRTAEERTEVALREKGSNALIAKVSYPDAAISKAGQSLPALDAPVILILLP